ncbi:hypothetical protein BaRGS_00015786, partial [Batillaria attramentaria]
QFALDTCSAHVGALGATGEARHPVYPIYCCMRMPAGLWDNQLLVDIRRKRRGCREAGVIVPISVGRKERVI